MASRAGLLFGQILLVILCIAFLLMSTCGGVFFVLTLGKPDYGIRPFAGLVFLICGGIVYGIIRAIRSIERKLAETK